MRFFFFCCCWVRKTIIGGAQIIDLMILVVDVTKGMQTQTAECLVIGEIVCPERLIIALNKVDQLPEDKRDQVIEKVGRVYWQRNGAIFCQKKKKKRCL